MGAVGADGGKKGMKSGWMKLRSKLCFFSMGNTGVIGQGMATVFSPDDFSVLCAFSQAWERVRTRWRVVGWSFLVFTTIKSKPT